MIGENENIISWEYNLFNAIKDVSDLNMQKLAWLGKSSNFVSSFSEVISILYDDFDFERYIEWYENSYGKNDFLHQMKILDKMISRYNPPYSTELILSDPNWIEITKQAENVFELRNKYLSNA